MGSLCLSYTTRIFTNPPNPYISRSHRNLQLQLSCRPFFSAIPNSQRFLLRRLSASPGPPPPPPQDPRPQKGLVPFQGLGGTLSKIQDSTRIFFAVFFWLSLFFWASAWDGRNKDRSNKGPRNRR